MIPRPAKFSSIQKLAEFWREHGFELEARQRAMARKNASPLVGFPLLNEVGKICEEVNKELCEEHPDVRDQYDWTTFNSSRKKPAARGVSQTEQPVEGKRQEQDTQPPPAQKERPTKPANARVREDEIDFDWVYQWIDCDIKEFGLNSSDAPNRATFVTLKQIQSDPVQRRQFAEKYWSAQRERQQKRADRRGETDAADLERAESRIIETFQALVLPTVAECYQDPTFERPFSPASQASG